MVERNHEVSNPTTKNLESDRPSFHPKESYIVPHYQLPRNETEIFYHKTIPGTVKHPSSCVLSIFYVFETLGL